MRSIRKRWQRFVLLCVLALSLTPLRATGPAPIYAHVGAALAAASNPYDDEFSSPVYSPQWHWVREEPGDWILTARAGSGGITEFAIPSARAGAEDITTGPDGALWFTENGSNKIGRITSSGSITEFTVPTPSSGLVSITVGPDGALWFTEALAGKIGRITTSGSITEFTVPMAHSSPTRITTGPDGALWFTDDVNSIIGRITLNGIFSEFTPPTAGSSPDGIATGPDGALWFTESGSDRIGRITPGGSITEFAIPTSQSVPNGITKGPDGALWFTEYGGNRIGRITPAGNVTEFTLPAAKSHPWEITNGPDGSLWFTESGGLTGEGSKLGRITPVGTITEFALPTPKSSPMGITRGPDGALWFVESDANKIGRLMLPRSAAPALLTPNQQHLANTIVSYKKEVDTAFQVLDGVTTQLGDEGQFFRDEVIRDQAGAALTIADSAIGVATSSAAALTGAAQRAYQNALEDFTQDLTTHLLKESSKELPAAALQDYLTKHTLKDQAYAMGKALDKRRAAVDGSLDALAAAVPKLSGEATGALITTIQERQQALAWVVTKLARGGSAAMHGAYLQKHSGQFLAALITAILQVGAPVLATALFGPLGTVAAKVAVGAWSVAMAKEQLTTDGKVAALYELALIGVESYAATIKREARSVAALVAATPLPPSPQGQMTDLTALELGIEHQATQTFDVKRAVVRVTVYNPGTTPVTYRVIATYSTTFDVPFGSTPPIPTTLDGFRRSSDQTLPRSDMMTALTVQPGQQASIDLALTDAGANLVLEPAAGTIIKIGLVATTADATKTPGSMLLQTAKVAYDGQSVSHHVVLASL